MVAGISAVSTFANPTSRVPVRGLTRRARPIWAPMSRRMRSARDAIRSASGSREFWW